MKNIYKPPIYKPIPRKEKHSNAFLIEELLNLTEKEVYATLNFDKAITRIGHTAVILYELEIPDETMEKDDCFKHKVMPQPGVNREDISISKYQVQGIIANVATSVSLGNDTSTYYTHNYE